MVVLLLLVLIALSLGAAYMDAPPVLRFATAPRRLLFRRSGSAAGRSSSRGTQGLPSAA
jgi:hypothetical protein